MENISNQIPDDNLSPQSDPQKNVNGSDVNLHLSYFDLSKKYNQGSDHIKHKPNTSLIIGKRKSGKTILANDIINNLHKIHTFESTILFTYDKTTCDLDNVNNVYIFSKDSLKEIIKKQKTNNKPVLIIFDDCVSNDINDNSNIKNIILSGRHLKIYSIFIMQYPIGIHPEIRINFDFVYCFKDNYTPNWFKIYNYFFGMIPSFTDFSDKIANSLNDYECVVADNFCFSHLLTDKVGLYKSNYK